MRKQQTRMLLIITLAFFLLQSGAPEAAMQHNPIRNRKVVLFVADYVSIEDLRSSDSFSWLLNESYIALMNNRQTGKAAHYKSKAAIGSGKRLDMLPDMLDGGKVERGLAYYKLNQLRKLNIDCGYEDYIGYIGNVIHANKGKSCFIGNSDNTVKDRSSLLIAMDGNGIVDFGSTDDVSIPDSRYPNHIRTDYSKLEELYKQFLPASSFLVIQPGDIERLEKNRDNLPEGEYMRLKKEILEQISFFAQNTILSYDTPPVLIFLSSFPSKASSTEGDKLTPVIVFDDRKEGVLTSEGTKRSGIILNTELAGYMLCKMGYSAVSSITEIQIANAASYILKLNGKTVNISKLRFPVLSTYAVFIILSLLMCSIALINPFVMKLGRVRPAEVLIVANLSGPLVLLILPAVFFRKPLPFLIAFFLTSMFIAFFLTKAIKDIRSQIFATCAATVSVLALDVILGSYLIKQSVLGYDPIIGARFYGIGNEFAGVFIGSSIILLSCLKEINHKSTKKRYVILYYSICICILGLPFLGANLGGVLSALSGYYISLLLLSGKQVRLRQIIVLPALLVLLIPLIVMTDFLNPGKNLSHVGRFVSEINENGLGVLFSTFSRKLAMNMRLIRYTIWTKVLLCIIFIMIILYFKPVGVVKTAFREHPALKTGWFSVAAASVIGLVLNDSGIVLAATAMIYVGFSLLLLCFELTSEVQRNKL